MDGEIFGHHRPGLEKVFFDIFKAENIDSLKMSDLLSKYERSRTHSPVDSTWATAEKDLIAGEPYHRWCGNDNPIQKMQWQLTDLAIAVTHRQSVDSKERGLLDRALHSDQYWWASARPWWSLEMIERGAYEFKSIVSGSSAARAEEKSEAEELYKSIVFTGFEWQRKGIVDRLSREEDEEVREFLAEKENTVLTKSEYAEMIRNWKIEMGEAADNGEYYRAGMLKDRIRELSEEMEKAKD